MKKIKMLVAGAAMTLAAVASLMAVAQPVGAVSCPDGSLRGSGAEVDNLAQCNVAEDEDGKGLMQTVQTIINVALAVLGLVTVVMIIVGGVSYTTSNGDPSKVAKAKNTILYGVVGLIIALLAFAIVNFVLDNIFSGSSSSSSSSSGGTTTTESASGPTL